MIPLSYVSTTYNMAQYFHKYFNAPSKENPRLDPLSTLVKLSILPYKPTGTKLSLESNYIYFHDPSIIQWAVRKYYRDSYNDLRDLTKTLHKAVEWYSKEERMRVLFEKSIEGLEKLKKTYGSTGKADAVQSYIDILSLKRKDDNESGSDSESKKESRSGSESSNSNNILDDAGTIDDVKLHQIMKDVWEEPDIVIVLSYFTKMERGYLDGIDKDVQDSIQGLEVVLKNIHNKIEEQVKIISSI